MTFTDYIFFCSGSFSYLRAAAYAVRRLRLKRGSDGLSCGISVLSWAVLRALGALLGIS